MADRSGSGPRSPSGAGQGVGVSPEQLRGWAGDTNDHADAIKRQLGPAGESCAALAQAAQGWDFVGSLPDMEGRWEDLNDLLTQRLNAAADNLRSCADDYDDNENSLIEFFEQLFG